MMGLCLLVAAACAVQRSNSSLIFPPAAGRCHPQPSSCLSLPVSPPPLHRPLSLPAAQGPLICLNAQQAPLAALKEVYPFVL